MTDAIAPLLAHIADALERLGPPAPLAPDFTAARLFRHEPASGAFVAAPDYPLSLDLLVGIDRQKARFVENLRRFAEGLVIRRWAFRICPIGHQWAVAYGIDERADASVVCDGVCHCWLLLLQQLKVHLKLVDTYSKTWLLQVDCKQLVN